MADLSIHIDSAALDKALSELPAKVAKRKLRTALIAAGELVQGAMVSLAPERTDDPAPDGDSLPPGVLKDDIQLDVQMNESGGDVRVGPGEIAGHVGRWQNNGWNWTTHKPGHKQIKGILGKHFAEAAFDESSEMALDIFTTALAEELFGGADD